MISILWLHDESMVVSEEYKEKDDEPSKFSLGPSVMLSAMSVVL